MSTRTMIDEAGREITVDEHTGCCVHLKVPLQVADGLPPPPTFALHRPGSVLLSDSERAASYQRILAHRQRVSEAWRAPNPLPTGDASPPTPSAAPSTAAQAYQAHVQRLQNAWRSR